MAMSHIVLGQSITASFELEEKCICLGLPGVWTAVLTNTSDTTITIYPRGSHNGQGMIYMYDLYAVDQKGDTIRTERRGLMLGGGRQIQIDLKKDSVYRETAFIIDYIPLEKTGIYEIGFDVSIDIKRQDKRVRTKDLAKKTERLRVRECRDRTIGKLLTKSVHRILTTDTLGLRLDGEEGSMLNLESMRIAKTKTEMTFGALEQIIEYPNLFVIVNAKRGMLKIDPDKAEEKISKTKVKYREECDLLWINGRNPNMTARNQRCYALFNLK